MVVLCVRAAKCVSTTPLVAAEWDYEGNSDTPDNVVAGSGRPVAWQCRACGYRWTSTPKARATKQQLWLPQVRSNEERDEEHRQGIGCWSALLCVDFLFLTVVALVSCLVCIQMLGRMW